MKTVELLGLKFERLLVIGEKNRGKNLSWVCQCDCGKTKCLKGSDLTTKKVRSCGCLNIQKIIDRTKSHGMSDTRFYRIWQAMKDRCLNPKNYRYKYYGGRGIKICKKWLHFENFKNDTFKEYEKHCEKFGIKNTSIDRINNNGNYIKRNCRWATQKQQVNNSRKIYEKK